MEDIKKIPALTWQRDKRSICGDMTRHQHKEEKRSLQGQTNAGAKQKTMHRRLRWVRDRPPTRTKRKVGCTSTGTPNEDLEQRHAPARENKQ